MMSSDTRTKTSHQPVGLVARFVNTSRCRSGLFWSGPHREVRLKFTLTFGSCSNARRRLLCVFLSVRCSLVCCIVMNVSRWRESKTRPAVWCYGVEKKLSKCRFARRRIVLKLHEKLSAEIKINMWMNKNHLICKYVFVFIEPFIW